MTTGRINQVSANDSAPGLGNTSITLSFTSTFKSEPGQLARRTSQNTNAIELRNDQLLGL